MRLLVSAFVLLASFAIAPARWNFALPAGTSFSYPPLRLHSPALCGASGIEFRFSDFEFLPARPSQVTGLPAVALAEAGHGPLTQEQVRALVARVIRNQHRDDAALYEFERIEHRISYRDSSVASDETYRIVPTGTGRLSLLVARGSQPVSLARYQKELRLWESALENALHPSDPAQQRVVALRQRRDRERAQLIDAIGRAFRFTWLGEQKVNGRALAHLALEPNPSFQPASRKEEMLRHVRADVWIDERAAQLVRGKAVIASDVPVAGGLLAEIYAGGWFRLEQSEAAPGVLLPASEEYSVRGRRIFFPYTEHKLTETSGYRRLGGPAQALEVVRKELASGKPFAL